MVAASTETLSGLELGILPSRFRTVLIERRIEKPLHEFPHLPSDSRAALPGSGRFHRRWWSGRGAIASGGVAN